MKRIPSPRWLLTSMAVLWGLGLTGVRSAHAECGDQCEIELESVMIEPAAPSCVDVKTHVQDCDCGVWFRFFNDCGTELSLDGRPVAPAEWGAAFQEIDSTGRAEWTWTMTTPEGEHQVTATTNVESFADPEAGCATSPGRSGNSGAMLAAAALLVVSLRRRAIRA